MSEEQIEAFWEDARVRVNFNDLRAYLGPSVLVCTTQVRVVPFDEVDSDHVHAEGEGDLSLEGWRDEHRRFFRESAGGVQVDPAMPVVLERFRVLYTAR